MTREVGRTEDGRYVVVDGRRWRTADPGLPDDVRERLLHHLGVARAGVRTAGRDGDEAAVAAARERGTAWWEQDDEARRVRWETALRELEA